MYIKKNYFIITFLEFLIETFIFITYFELSLEKNKKQKN